MGLYQLMIPNGMQHCVYIFFSNGLAGKDRFCVCVLLKRLSPDETQRWAEKIVSYHGSADVLDRHHMSLNGDYQSVRLEYMRYCICFSGDKPPRVFCMDTLCDVVDPSESALISGSASLSAASCTSGTGCQSPMPEQETPASRWRDIPFNTSSHGTVVVRLSTFPDPDIRSSCNVYPGGVVTTDNCYGALVKPTNPRRLILRRALRLPPAIPHGFATIASVNKSDFYEISSGTFTEGGKERKMLVPRGGHGAVYRNKSIGEAPCNPTASF